MSKIFGISSYRKPDSTSAASTLRAYLPMKFLCIKKKKSAKTTENIYLIIVANKCFLHAKLAFFYFSVKMAFGAENYQIHVKDFSNNSAFLFPLLQKCQYRFINFFICFQHNKLCTSTCFRKRTE